MKAKNEAYKVYGIPNCNTVKKAVDWLKANGILYNFHNYKTEGIDADTLQQWSEQKGWESLLNKKGTTWRGLDADTQSAVISKDTAITLMADKTSLIKRPVIQKGNKIVALGFDEEVYRKVFK